VRDFFVRPVSVFLSANGTNQRLKNRAHASDGNDKSLTIPCESANQMKAGNEQREQFENITEKSNAFFMVPQINPVIPPSPHDNCDDADQPTHYTNAHNNNMYSLNTYQNDCPTPHHAHSFSFSNHYPLDDNKRSSFHSTTNAGPSPHHHSRQRPHSRKCMLCSYS
jgi:hypothetical protein